MENLERRTKNLREYCMSVEEAPIGGGIYYPVKVLSKKIPFLVRTIKNFFEQLLPTDNPNKANEIRQKLINQYRLKNEDVVFYGIYVSGGCFGGP